MTQVKYRGCNPCAHRPRSPAVLMRLACHRPSTRRTIQSGLAASAPRRAASSSVARRGPNRRRRARAPSRRPRWNDHTVTASVASSRSSTGSAAEQRAEERLAGRADDHRHAGDRPRRAAARAAARDCARAVLPNPMPGSTRMPVVGHAGGDRGVDATAEILADLAHDVVVRRILLHRARRALHVHRDEAGSGSATTRQHRSRRRCRPTRR